MQRKHLANNLFHELQKYTDTHYIPLQLSKRAIGRFRFYFIISELFLLHASCRAFIYDWNQIVIYVHHMCSPQWVMDGRLDRQMAKCLVVRFTAKFVHRNSDVVSYI